ncbi:MAG: S9 family peptidase [Holophagales bacterium]|nr:MAG: S9 family peptidase [Holophagales bacterium]
MRRIPFALVAFALGASARLAPAAETAAVRPPESRVAPVREVVHGVEIVDPYRWLEGDNSDPKQMGRVTPEVAAWTDAQNAYTRRVLDSLPGRAALEERLRPLMEVGSVSAPRVRAGRYFYTQREGSQSQPVVLWRQGVRGTPRTLLDPAALDPSGLTTVAWFSPSPDGEVVAYGTYRAGDENATLHLIRVASGEKLPLEIPNKVEAPEWLPDGSGFVYRNLEDPKDPYSGRVRFHRLGTAPTADPVLFRQFTVEENKQLATTWGPTGALSRDGRWLLLGYSTSTRSNDLWVADFGAFLSTGKVEKREITVGAEGLASGSVVGDTLVMWTTQGAPNGCVMTVDLRHPEKSAWKSLVPERSDAVIQRVAVGKGVVAVNYLQKAASRVELFDLAGARLGELKLPGLGSADLAAELESTEAFLSFRSFNYPATVFRVDLTKPAAEPELWERPAVPVDPATVDVEQVSYPSKDGTPVTMFLAHRKGLVRNGDNPTILSGYGGFNISQTPAFSAPLFQWFEAGGVLALPNLRGGGEYGDAWHQAGMLEKKQNVFDDFIAAAEWLIAQKITRPARLAISGGSNGGLLTGAMVVQRPDLFRAAIVAVPLLDMLRYQDFLMARYWVPEYGSAEDPKQFEALRAYSPYHHVQEGVAYPAVLLTAGENDTRVHALHARKMTARLQAATASNAAEKPVLLWVDREAGHGQGKPLALRVRDAADQRIFVMWQLGMLAAPPAAGVTSR